MKAAANTSKAYFRQKYYGNMDINIQVTGICILRSHILHELDIDELIYIACFMGLARPAYAPRPSPKLEAGCHHDAKRLDISTGCGGANCIIKGLTLVLR